MPSTAADRHDPWPIGGRHHRADSIAAEDGECGTADATLTARSAFRQPTVPKSRLPDRSTRTATSRSRSWIASRTCGSPVAPGSTSPSGGRRRPARTVALRRARRRGRAPARAWRPSRRPKTLWLTASSMRRSRAGRSSRHPVRGHLAAGWSPGRTSGGAPSARRGRAPRRNGFRHRLRMPRLPARLTYRTVSPGAGTVVSSSTRTSSIVNPSASAR